MYTNCGLLFYTQTNIICTVQHVVHIVHSNIQTVYRKKRIKEVREKKMTRERRRGEPTEKQREGGDERGAKRGGRRESK